MGEEIYKPLIEDMTWSYSRIECFKDCKYRFFLKYIAGCKDSPRFYSSYGSFIHKLIEQYYIGMLSRDEMRDRFLSCFKNEVKGDRPSDKIVSNYIQYGLRYIKQFDDFPFRMIDVEREVKFKIGSNNFIGYIDYLGERDGDFYIIDHKSRDLKPRNKKKRTAKDEELDKMLRQLYLYSVPIKEEYGKSPKSLCFNCFRTGVFIEEPFNEESFKSTIDWVEKSIEQIKEENDFEPTIDYFACKYICGVSDECCYCQRR